MQIYLFLNDQQVGPYSEEQVRSMVAAGTATQTDNAWYEGLTDWQPLNTIIGFVQAPAAPSPRQSQLVQTVKGAKGKPSLTCKVCGEGELVKRKKYRMSTPVGRGSGHR